MYINWCYEYIPKMFLLLSLIFNSIFIYLNLSDRKKTLGNYRHFLLAFSIFNAIYSIVEVVVPIAVYGSDYLVLIYLSGGPFFQDHDLGLTATSTRCGFIANSYAILTIHFFYRYFALFNPPVIGKLTSKAGILLLFLFFLTYGIVWGGVCQKLMYGTDDARDVVRSEFLDDFGIDISQISCLNVMFKSVNMRTVYRCWFGITVLAGISLTSISLYCVLGYKIVKKLQDVHHVSKITRKLHRQLFHTLAIQTAIPTIVSFLPCMIVWFIPLFGFHMGGQYGNIGVITLSAFPSLDALAVILLLPVYRHRFTTVISKTSSMKLHS